MAWGRSEPCSVVLVQLSPLVHWKGFECVSKANDCIFVPPLLTFMERCLFLVQGAPGGEWTDCGHLAEDGADHI